MIKLIDIHCHFMPYVDDGANDLDEALEALQEYAEQGIAAVILTPHYRSNMFETTQDMMLEQYRRLRVQAEKLGIRLFPGCEYHADAEMVSNLNAGRRWTLAGSEYVLTEFSSRHTLRDIQTKVQELRKNAYRPVLAHVERYPAVRDSADPCREIYGLIEQGALIQINADAVLGMDGRILQKFSRMMLDRELVHFVASDAHGRAYRPSHLRECCDWISRRYGEDTAERLMLDNPMRILRAGAQRHTEE